LPAVTQPGRAERPPQRPKRHFGTAAGGFYRIEKALKFALCRPNADRTMAERRYFHGTNQRDLNFFLVNQLPP
jgi:hypothetical protein